MEKQELRLQNLCGKAICGSLVAQMVKGAPSAMHKTTGSISGLERSHGDGMATHSNILAWRIPTFYDFSLM